MPVTQDGRFFWRGDGTNPFRKCIWRSSLGNYELWEVEEGGRIHVMLVNEKHCWSDWPMLTSDGRVLYDNPGMFPAYVKRVVQRVLSKRKEATCPRNSG